MTSIKKSQDAEHYIVRVSGEWANIFLTPQGLFVAESSFGTYSYGWYHHGCESFKHFLVGLLNSQDYAMSKLGKKDSFDVDTSIKLIRENLLDARRPGKLTKDGAAYLWENLADLGNNFGHSIDRFLDELSYFAAFEEMYPDGDYPIVKDYDVQLKEFMRRIFPVFAEELKKELAAPVKDEDAGLD